jgi:hypothetical protein
MKFGLTFRVKRRTTVFENGVLRKIAGPKRDEVTGKWRRLHNERLNVLYTYFSLGIIRVIKSRIMRCMWQVARMENRRGAYRVMVGRSEGKSHLEDIGIDGKIILKWVSKKWDREAWIGVI